MLGEIGILGLVNRFHHKSGWRPVKIISVARRRLADVFPGGPRVWASPTGMWTAEQRVKERRPGAGENTRAPKGIECILHLQNTRGGPATFLSPPGHPGRARAPSCGEALLLPTYPAPANPAGCPSLRNVPASRRIPFCGTTSMFHHPCGSDSATRHYGEPVRKGPELL